MLTETLTFILAITSAISSSCYIHSMQSDALAPQSTEMDAYEQTLKQHPSDEAACKGEVDTAIREALSMRREGNNELALTFLLRGSYWVQDAPELLTDIGIQEEAMNLYSDADATLEKAHKIRPEDLKTIYAIARAKMELNQVQASEKAWIAYLAQRPDDASAHFGYGLLLQMLQRTSEARVQFEKSIALSPHQSESYYRLGEIARDAGEFEQAKQFYSQTIERSPQHAGAWTGLGILAYKAKQYDESNSDLEKAIQYSPDFQIARYYHGLVLGKLGLKSASEKELATAIELANEENTKKDQIKRLSAQPYKPQ